MMQFVFLVVVIFFALPACVSSVTQTKTLLRFAIYYDITNANIEPLIEEELSGYLNTEELAGNYLLQIERYRQEFTDDFGEVLRSRPFTAVVVASRQIDCVALGPYFKLLPFFYVTSSSRNCDQDLDYNRIFYMMPPDSSLMAAFFTGIKEYKWNSAAVLYNKNKEIQFTFQDIQEARARGVDVVGFEAKESEESIREKLIQARREGIRTYVLVSSYTRLIRIMSVARQLHLSTSNFHWFIPNVMLNPQVLHEFLNDGVRITFLHSPLITPMTLALLNANANLTENGDLLYETVVKTLVRTMSRSLVTACGLVRTDPNVDESCRVYEHYHHSKVHVCGIHVEKVSAADVTHGTVTSVTPDVTDSAPITANHAHGDDTTTTTHGHGHIETTTTSGHDHMATTKTSGHGHMATTTNPGQGHMATTTTSGRRRRMVTITSGHGHMATTTTIGHGNMTTTTTPGHGNMATTTTNGHGHMATTTTPGHGHMTTTTTPGHGNTATTTTSGHGHMATTTTNGHGNTATITTNGHGHMATTTTPGHGNTATTTTSGHGHMTTTSTVGHGHMATTTTPGHGHMATTTTTGQGNTATTTTSGHGHMATTTTAGHDYTATTTTNGHDNMATTTTIGHDNTATTTTNGHDHMATTTTSGHGHMVTTTTSGHGHMATTTTSGHGHMATTTTSGHGHMATTTTSGYGHMATATPNDVSDGHSQHAGQPSGTDTTTEIYEKCLQVSLNPSDLATNPFGSAQSSITGGEHNGHHMKKRATPAQQGHEAHSASFEIATKFDPCPFHSNYQWSYAEESCPYKFFDLLTINDSTAIFTLEHIHGYVNGHVVHQVLSVGARNGARSYANVTYKPFKTEQVSMTSLVLGAVWNPPWLSWEIEDGLPVPGTFNGYLYDLIVALSERMKFNFTVDGELAARFGPNMNLTEEELEREMNALFENDTCDLFLYDKVLHGGRIQLSDTVSTTISIQTLKMYLLKKRMPKNQGVSIWQFLAPFKEESWALLWTTLVLVALLMTYINKHNPYEFRWASRDLRVGAKRSEHLGFLNSMWFNFAALVEQSSQFLPRSASLKVLAGTWWFFVMLVIAAYTANMISFMTQVDSEGITTLDQLASQQEVEYGLMANNPLLSKLLPIAKDHPYSAVWTFVKRDLNSTVMEKLSSALERVDTGTFILIAAFKSVVRALQQSCEYDQVGDGFYQYYVGLPLRKGTIALPALNDNISHLRDIGQLGDLQQKWFGELEKECEGSTSLISVGDSGGQLDIKAFIGMYVFLGLGLAGGFIICFFETGYIKYGGFGGLTGRARKYELRKNTREILKPEKAMADEFEKWPGGWDVLKHMPYIKEQHDDRVDTAKEYSVNTVTASSIDKQYYCCPSCGQEDHDLPTLIRKRQTAMKDDESLDGKDIDDSTSEETGYRSGYTSVAS